MDVMMQPVDDRRIPVFLEITVLADVPVVHRDEHEVTNKITLSAVRAVYGLPLLVRTPSAEPVATSEAFARNLEFLSTTNSVRCIL